MHNHVEGLQNSTDDIDKNNGEVACHMAIYNPCIVAEKVHTWV